MTNSLDQFTRQLVDTGLMTADDVAAIVSALPADQRPKDADALARELVRLRRLTAFQARQLLQCDGAGLVLGNYVLIDKLGQGGMGQVYRAQHRRMKRVVALKVLPPALVDNDAALRRFEREVEAAARLSHPNIVTAHDADEAGGQHFLVMECVEGCDLGALVKQRGPLAVEQAVDCILQAARGLDHAHQQGVIHRDIKPGNLLIDTRGTVKVLDMGLARVDLAGGDDADGRTELTQSGMIMGTVDYMAPEQAANTRLADARSDIYALGCTFHFLLTGRPPYQADTTLRKLVAHRTAPIPPLVASHGEVPPEVEAIYRRMLAKQPEERFATMAECIAALEAWRGDATAITVRPPTLLTATTDEPELAHFLAGLGGAPPVAAARRPPAVVEQTAIDTQAEQSAQRTQAFVPGATTTSADSTANRASSTKSRRRKQTLVAIGLAAIGLPLLIWLALSLSDLGAPPAHVVLQIDPAGSDIQVTMQGQNIPISDFRDAEPLKFDFPPGRRELRINRRGFEPFVQSLELRPEETETIVAQLQRIKPKFTWPAGTPPPAIVPFDAEAARSHQQAWADHLGVPVEYTNSIGMKFALIPPGEFDMGSTPEEIEWALAHGAAQVYVDGEHPQHRAVLPKAFYLGIHEVTQSQYEAVIGTNPSHFAPTGEGKDTVAGQDTKTFPVDHVSWADAAEFFALLAEREGMKPDYFRAGENITFLKGNGYRFPTEAEWEFACRAGTTTRYYCGDSDEALLQTAWTTANAGGRPHAAGELQPNPFGLFDLLGNQWEWMRDTWDPTYYGQLTAESMIDPQGPPLGTERVIRGSAWDYISPFCRTSARFYDPASLRTTFIGFRAALSIEGVKAAGRSQQAASELPAAPEWNGWSPDDPPPAIAPFDADQARRHQEEWAAHLELPVEYTNNIGMTFRLIPPGEFLMGSTKEEIADELKLVVGEGGVNEHWRQRLPSEGPQHRVILSRPTYLGVHEVTQRQYEKVMGVNPSAFAAAGGGNTRQHPVEMVSWTDAVEFCAKLSAQVARQPPDAPSDDVTTPRDEAAYRLPTEAEWEFACRAGTTARFWCGDRPEQLAVAAWFNQNAGQRTHAVAELAANPFGLFDVHGNVWEYCQDWWQPTYYSQFRTSPAIDPSGPASGTLRVFRGGGWPQDASRCRSSGRDADDASPSCDHIGFRVSLSVDAVRRTLKSARGN